MIAGVPGEVIALIPVPVVALFLGWSTHNDVAHDHTAIWLHIVSNTRGFHDRVGRAVPALLLGVPAVLVVSLLCAGIYGDPLVLPAMVGVGLGILGAGIGVSAVVSARFPYPAVLPGESPFSQPASGNGGLVQALTFVAIIALSAPVLALGAASVTIGGAYPWATLAGGLLLGFLVLLGGLELGGRIFDRRGPDLLESALRG